MSVNKKESIFKEESIEVNTEEKKEKPVFIQHNDGKFCGKIIKKYMKHDNELVLVLSCGQRIRNNIDKDGNKKEPKKNKDGLIIRELIPIRFFDTAAKYYDEKYNEGDFVRINTTMQTVRNRHNNTNHLEFWGSSILPKKEKRKTYPDRNDVYLKGKIISASKINNNYIILNIETKLEKNISISDSKTKAEKYISITPVGVRCHEDALKELDTKYTPGTWVDVFGHIFTKDVKIGETVKKSPRIIATSIKVVGNVQPRKVV